MEEKFVKLFLQQFAEESVENTAEESETTDLNDEETDSELEFTNSDEEETSEPAKSAEEPEKVKTFTQEELDSIVETRLNRERKRLDKKYNAELSKYEELAYLTKEGLKADSYEDALVKTRDFYGKQGIKYTPGRSAKEEEILATAEAQEILDTCESTDDIESEVQRLLSKGNNISIREKNIAQKLTDELTNRVRISELSKLGVKEEVYNSKEFKDFEKHFTKDTPISFVYEQYKAKTKTTKVVDNPGSMKSIPAKEKKNFISEAEYDKMTDKEIEANMDLIKESMTKW